MPDVLSFVLWATLGMIVVSIVGFLLARRVRAWYQGGTGDGGGAPFTLQDLRTMRANGEISESEYESMRAAIIGQVAADRPGRVPPPGTRSSPPRETGSPGSAEK